MVRRTCDGHGQVVGRISRIFVSCIYSENSDNMKEDHSVLSSKLGGGPMGLGKLLYFLFFRHACLAKGSIVKSGEVPLSPVRNVENCR